MVFFSLYIFFDCIAMLLFYCSFIMRESSYCFQRILAIVILSVRLSVRHTGGSVKNGAR